MEIELKSYNIKDAEWELIRKCFYDNPDKNIEEIAELLGLSERSLYRKIKGTEFNYQDRKILNAILILEKEGFEIKKKD